jgi:hypothetical protein
VNAATPGTTLEVCAGTYSEQVTVGVSNLTIEGAGTSTIVDPSTLTPSTVSDLDTHQPIVPIFDVSGQSNVTITGLTVEGSGLTTSFSWPGCGDNFVGVLSQNASATLSNVTVEGIKLPPALFGCQDGLAVFAQSSVGPQNTLTVVHSTITNYDKNGVTCVDKYTTCSVAQSTITGMGPTDGIAQNGVQIGPGAPGSVVDHNNVSGNDYTGATNTVEPQADYAAGILLYDGTGSEEVNQNTLTDDQIGVEAVATTATINQNTISQTSGIENSVGIFAVACDFYCGSFGLSGNANVNDAIVHNEISFVTATSGTVGIWTDDSAANTGTGRVIGQLVKNDISGAATPFENG